MASPLEDLRMAWVMLSAPSGSRPAPGLRPTTEQGETYKQTRSRHRCAPCPVAFTASHGRSADGTSRWTARAGPSKPSVPDLEEHRSPISGRSKPLGHARLGDLPVPGRNAGNFRRDGQHRRRLSGADHTSSRGHHAEHSHPLRLQAFSELRSGPIVVERPAKSDKASLY